MSTTKSDENNTELEINTLDRFSKKSSRLMLEEYSHCEVPAGCGGVVLRWLNPAEELPFRYYLFCRGKIISYIDGKRVGSSRLLLGHGEHVLSICIDDKAGPAAILFVLLFEGNTPAAYTEPARSGNVGTAIILRSGIDGRCRVSSTAPRDNHWVDLGFDDSTWAEATIGGLAAPLSSDETYRYNETAKHGALAVSSKQKSNALWLRFRFSIELQSVDETTITR